MDKSKIPARLKLRHEKTDYDKVYEHPLDWCPLFGDLPEIEETHLNNNDLAESTARNCINIILAARWRLGAFDNYQVQYARLPDVKELLFIYHDYGEACKAVRILFQNLDYLALKTANHHIADTYYNLFRSSIHDLKHGPIRNTPYNTLASNLLENVDVLKAPGGLESLLIYAEEITSYPFELKRHHLFALYAILEAWLVLTSLIFHNKWTQEDINGLSPFIDKAENLLKASEYFEWAEEKDQLTNEVAKSKQEKSSGGKHEKTAGFRVAQAKAIKQIKSTGGRKIVKYFEKNHTGEDKAMDISYEGKNYKVYYDLDLEKFIQRTLSTKKHNTTKTNTEKQFLANLTEAKKIKIPE
ncbi:MAG: hypothetical protein FD159_913 [Syntrophaceae bacterium]|nr:MAG: hypothetical protein FD159_913 [Syntrophaceae bacterium]